MKRKLLVVAIATALSIASMSVSAADEKPVPWTPFQVVLGVVVGVAVSAATLGLAAPVAHGLLAAGGIYGGVKAAESIEKK